MKCALFCDIPSMEETLPKNNDQIKINFPEISREWKYGIAGGVFMAILGAYPAYLAITNIIAYAK